MPFRWVARGKTFFTIDDAIRTFGVTLEDLLRWNFAGELSMASFHGSPVIEEQSLRACIARHQRDEVK